LTLSLILKYGQERLVKPQIDVRECDRPLPLSELFVNGQQEVGQPVQYGKLSTEIVCQKLPRQILFVFRRQQTHFRLQLILDRRLRVRRRLRRLLVDVALKLLVAQAKRWRDVTFQQRFGRLFFAILKIKE
jgi:hypothetical protein